MKKQIENKKEEQIHKIRHSLSHLLAAAVLEKWPKTKLAIGPVIDNGFYYDFDFPAPISDKDLESLEKRMRELARQNLDFTKKKITFIQAKKLFVKASYKMELIKELNQKKSSLSIYETSVGKGKLKKEVFMDLCSGPHVNNTNEINSEGLKLTHLAGAYWRGDEKNKMLTRIYGVAFEDKKTLNEYLKMMEEAEKRDHRKLGRELDLFTFSEYIGSGLPLYTPRGALIRRLLNDYIESLQVKAGYTQVWTPQIAKAELFKISGHYDKYKNDMFRVVSNYSDEEFYLKPMNCPQHTQIYKSRARSYRDLPIRYTDFAMLYRDERPGELSGLARVRSFSQDDCHIFCREDQVDKEIDTALEMTKKVMGIFGFKYKYRLSTRDPKHPEKYLGDPKTWDKVEKWAEKIMKRNKIEYFDGPGEAAFYAPKMDLIATDALGRDWQLSTVQIDFVFPERFGLTYIDKDGKEKHPVMIHRAIIGSPERFIMVLLEHYAGAFPLWLSPVQIEVIPVSEKHLNYAKEIEEKIKENGARVEVADANETLGKRIREAELQKIPYVLIVGDKEKQSNSVSIRSYKKGQEGEMKIDKFIEKIVKEIKNRE
ncbi:MAG: threonine--tRNA ligase [Candidatus Paceibacterota bacterium]|jgi:threonyl-tRNA synthetase